MSILFFFVFNLLETRASKPQKRNWQRNHTSFSANNLRESHSQSSGWSLRVWSRRYGWHVRLLVSLAILLAGFEREEAKILWGSQRRARHRCCVANFLAFLYAFLKAPVLMLIKVKNWHCAYFFNDRATSNTLRNRLVKI